MKIVEGWYMPTYEQHFEKEINYIVNETIKSK